MLEANNYCHMQVDALLSLNKKMVAYTKYVEGMVKDGLLSQEMLGITKESQNFIVLRR